MSNSLAVSRSVQKNINLSQLQAQITITRKGLAILNNTKSYQLVTRALLTGDEAVGALLEWVLGEVQYYLLQDLQPYLGVCGALPVLLQSLLGLGKVATSSLSPLK